MQNDIHILNKLPKQKDFPKEAYRLLFQAESKHFWFWGRNRIINDTIRQTMKEIESKTFLEIGCGSGIVLSGLEKLGLKLKGLDMHLEGLKFARKRTKAALYCADSRKAIFKEKFDAIGLFDVIEHIDDDRIFLKDCKKFLKKNGYLYVTVPAHMMLWSKSDVASGHKRRYTKKSLEKVLSSAGYKVKIIKYFNFYLFLPQIIFRKLIDRKLKSKRKSNMSSLGEGLKLPSPFLNIFLKGAAYAESLLVSHISLPIGSSIIAVAKTK